MSGDLQARRGQGLGSKLKNRQKKKPALEPEADVDNSVVKNQTLKNDELI